MSATILCVQDDRAVHELHAEALRAEGYEVLRACDGGQALEVLRRETPDFIVLDVFLPRQDGFEILADLRSMPGREQLPVLLLCEGDSTPELEARAKSLGALAIEPSPIDVDRLLGWIADAVKRAAPSTRSKGSETPGVERLPREGWLREIPFPELLHRIRRAALDGVVLLEHGDKKKAIEMRGGWPVSIKSNLVSECLGSYLIHQGRCTKAQLDQSVQRMRAGEGLQGEILVAMDVLDEAGVVAAIQEHALEKVYEIFGWLDGHFAVRTGARVQRGTSIGLDGHPTRLIVEGVRRATPRKVIDRFFERRRECFLMLGDEVDTRGVESLELEPKDLDWIRNLDGSMRVAALAEEPDAFRRLAYALLAIDVLRLGPEAGSREAARSAAVAFGGAADPSSSRAEEEQVRVELTELGNRLQDKDHYGVLGVSSTAGDEEIRNAYAALAKRAHPDRYHGASSSVRELATRVFGRISEAYEAISTVERRAAHAKARSLGQRVSEVEDEGRRALAAETEFQRGEALMGSRDYEGALACFGRAVERFPSEGEYRSHYGWCLYLCHPDNEVMLGEAFEHCREGIKLAKDREKPYLLLGRLYKAMGKTGAARKLFTRAVQIRPQCVEAMRELRIMNMRREKDKGVLKRLFKR